MSDLRTILKNYLLKETYNQELLDMILDKISKYGEKSLNGHEREILKNISTKNKKYNSDWDLIIDFLDFNIGHLKGDSYYTNRIGKKVSGIKYFDKSNNFLFDLEVESEVLGIKKQINTLYASDEIKDLLKNNFTISDIDIKKVVKAWFEKNTNTKVSTMDFWLNNKP